MLVLLAASIVVVAQIALSPGASSAPPAPPAQVPVHGAVGADGTRETAGPWRVERPSVGRYLLRLEDPPSAWPDVEITSWDAAGDVTVVPRGHGEVFVFFAHAGSAVDSRFRFTAS